jgi:hypothetical protein
MDAFVALKLVTEALTVLLLTRYAFIKDALVTLKLADEKLVALLFNIYDCPIEI